MTTVSEPGEPNEPAVVRDVTDKEGVAEGITRKDVDDLAESYDQITEDSPGLLVIPLLEPTHLNWRFYLGAAFRTRPGTTFLTAGMAAPGIYALILGAGSSQAFTNLVGIRGAQLIAHSLGTALLFGAILGLIGLAKDDRFIELMGLVLIIAGASMYTIGVVLGLGAKGGMAALGYAVIAVAVAARTVLVLSQIPHGKKRSKVENGG